MLRGRNVHIFSDNTSAEHNTSKGRAKSFDHTMMIHSIWCAYAFHMSTYAISIYLTSWFDRSLALEESMGLYVSRVASKENIADDPSRY